MRKESTRGGEHVREDIGSQDMGSQVGLVHEILAPWAAE